MEDQSKTIRFDDKGNTLLSIPMSRVPVKQWDDWNEPCKSFYGGNRWQKVWSDHEKAKAYDLLVELMHTPNQSKIDEVNTDQLVQPDDNELELLNPEESKKV